MFHVEHGRISGHCAGQRIQIGPADEDLGAGAVADDRRAFPGTRCRQPLIGCRLLFRLDRRPSLGLLHLRAGDEELPPEQHDHAEHDGKDHVAVVDLHYLSFRRRSA